LYLIALLFQLLVVELAKERIGTHHAALLLKYNADWWSEKFL